MQENAKQLKKKIIVIINSLQIGGAEKHLVTLLPKLMEKGWSFRVITTAEKGNLAADLETKGIPVLCLLSEGQLKFIEKLPRLPGRLLRIFLSITRLAVHLKKEKKESILHFFLPEAYMLGMYAASIARFPGPKIMSRRSLNDYQKKRPLIGWLESKLHKRTSLICGNSQAILMQLNQEEKVPQTHLRLIYNGIDTTLFSTLSEQSDVRKKLGIPEDALVLVMIANLIPYKGHLDLLNALNIVKDKLPPSWFCLCVGKDKNDGYKGILQAKTQEVSLEKHLIWLGIRNDVPSLLKSANIGILCSHEEGFSNAILEGMAACLPMIVTDVGGNKEAVLQGETGLVVPPRNPEALANALLELIHSGKAIQFGQAGRNRIEEKFSLEACVDNYDKIYESLS